MSAAHKLKWPTVFSGLKGATWANFPSEISAGITLAAYEIGYYHGRKGNVQNSRDLGLLVRSLPHRPQGYYPLRPSVGLVLDRPSLVRRVRP